MVDAHFGLAYHNGQTVLKALGERCRAGLGGVDDVCTNGVAAMATSDVYGKIRVHDGIVGYAGLAPSIAVENTLQAQITASGAP